MSEKKESLRGMITRIYNDFTKPKPEAKEKDMARANAKDVPMGSGGAGQARKQVAGRARQIDDAVESMSR